LPVLVEELGDHPVRSAEDRLLAGEHAVVVPGAPVEREQRLGALGIERAAGGGIRAVVLADLRQERLLLRLDLPDRVALLVRARRLEALDVFCDASAAAAVSGSCERE
jgi:hypothetical protein